MMINVKIVVIFGVFISGKGYKEIFRIDGNVLCFGLCVGQIYIYIYNFVCM